VFMNNSSQLAKACQAYESKLGSFPGGGWGWGWVGDPSRGTGFRQPGGWIYSILPYIDQPDLHDAFPSQVNTTLPWPYNVPLSITICPSRRAVRAYTCNSNGMVNYSLPSPPLMGRSDYASNGGDVLPSNSIWSSPCGNSSACGPSSLPNDLTLLTAKQAADGYGATGLDYPLSSISSASIKDGFGFTYLLGEKSIDPDNYTTGKSLGDSNNQYVGHSSDISRWTATAGAPLPPQQDKPGASPLGFGSAHSAGFHMAFCDGSVRKINFNIDPSLHMQLSNRADGRPTQLQLLDDVSR